VKITYYDKQKKYQHGNKHYKNLTTCYIAYYAPRLAVRQKIGHKRGEGRHKMHNFSAFNRHTRPYRQVRILKAGPHWRRQDAMAARQSPAGYRMIQNLNGCPAAG